MLANSPSCYPDHPSVFMLRWPVLTWCGEPQWGVWREWWRFTLLNSQQVGKYHHGCDVVIMSNNVYITYKTSQELRMLSRSLSAIFISDDLFRCASISWFEVVSKSVIHLFQIFSESSDSSDSSKSSNSRDSSKSSNSRDSSKLYYKFIETREIWHRWKA